MKPQQVIYQHSKDRYFDNLVGFIVNAASLATCFEAEEYGKANRFDATHYISIIGNPKVSGLEIRFYPHLTLQTLIKNQWPTTISIEKLSINLNPPAHPIFLTTLKKFTQ